MRNLGKPSEIDDSKEPHQLINTTSDYLANPYFTQLQTFQTQFTGSDFTDSDDENILTKGGISPYVLNNNLITNVSTVGGTGEWWRNSRPTPNVLDSLKGYTSRNSATLLYKSLTKDIPGANGMNQEMDFDMYGFGAEGFSVYERAIEGNTWPTTTPLQAVNNSSTWTQEMLIF